LIHSGLLQAARASRKMFILKGRNFRFEYMAKTGICGEAHFGKTTSLKLLPIVSVHSWNGIPIEATHDHYVLDTAYTT
jgi:ABC-type polysaccharide/polyol phosphate transport system ATPase subunit